MRSAYKVAFIKHTVYDLRNECTVQNMSATEELNTYRPSASVIIAAKSGDGTKISTQYDYSVLVCKRALSTAFLPEHCVFPGGAHESDADESIDWLQYFYEFGITRDQLQVLVVNGPKRPQPLLTGGVNFPRDISLRITAVRETFEEVGILLCRDPNFVSHTCSYGQFRENFDRVYWQNAVHDNPKQFLQLCQSLKVVPDIWNLIEWSVWRSPVTSTKKFDTVFYLVALEQQPNLLLESSEMEESLWCSPTACLSLFTQRSIWLPYVQFYELSRLTNMPNLDQLLRFAYKRRNKGSTLLMPIYYRCNDGLVGVFSGDDFHTLEASAQKNTIELNISTSEFRKRTQNIHRLIIRDVHDLSIELTVPPIDAHLSPLQQLHVNSKL